MDWGQIVRINLSLFKALCMLGSECLICSCNIKIANDPHIPISGYTFGSSKALVTSKLDSIIDSDSQSWSYLPKRFNAGSAEIGFSQGNDTVHYLAYFPGDELHWVQETDSTSFVLGGLAKYRTGIGRIKVNDSTERKRLQNIFEERIIGRLRRALINAPDFEYRQLSEGATYPRIWEVCSPSKGCDTLMIQWSRELGHHVRVD